MSDTPRTDAVVAKYDYAHESYGELEDLARQLERELAARPEDAPTLTDEQIINAAANAADAPDATRVHEMRNGGWHSTTIFDGDAGLIRFGRLVLRASQPQDSGR